MTVAHDAATISSQWDSTPDPFTFVHTPVGTPAGVLVLIPKSGSGSSFLTGITYGGVAMTIDLTNWYAEDAVGETCSVFAGFLGASIPTGAQTVSINWAGSTTTVKVAVCITVTAAGDTEITTFAKDEGDQANPSAALDTGATESLRYAGISSGLGATSSLALLANMTAVANHDFGAQVASVDRQTTASTGSFTTGWTAASDDVAALYLAIQEISGGTAHTATQTDPVGLTDTTTVELAAVHSETDLLGFLDSLVIELATVGTFTKTDSLGLADSIVVAHGIYTIGGNRPPPAHHKAQLRAITGWYPNISRSKLWKLLNP